MRLEVAEQNSAQPEAAAKFAFPTTFAQQRLWFFEQLQPGGTSYLVSWFLRIEGALDVSALESSLRDIVARHEVFRTTFTCKDGLPLEIIGPWSFSLPLLDVSQQEDAWEKATAPSL